MGAAPLGSGHIHDTFAVGIRTPAGVRRAVLQRLNTRVFPDPEVLAGNLAVVTAHLRERLARLGVRDLERRVLRPLESAEGGLLVWMPEGTVWRAFAYIEGTRSRSAVDGPATAHEAARAFGEFARLLSDLPTSTLAEPLPRFHDLDHRLEQLRDAALRDPAGRLAEVRQDLDASLELAEGVAVRLREADVAGLPRRAVHNDCKLDNLLLDERTDRALCVIDLDTVMPGTLLADFGELVRTASSTAPEDEPVLDRVRPVPSHLRAIAEGFLAGIGDALDPRERAALPLGGPLLALENAVRFLADHLEGDVYFRVHREGHNLDRHRAQRELARALLASEAELRRHLGT